MCGAQTEASACKPEKATCHVMKPTGEAVPPFPAECCRTARQEVHTQLDLREKDGRGSKVGNGIWQL